MALLTRLQLQDAVVLNPNYYVLMESHLSFLRTHQKTALINISGQAAEKYTGDFYGLLDSLSIRKNHYLILRLNGMYSSTDYDGQQLEFLIPDEAAVNRILTTYRSIEK
jgi:hypothetical protein